MRNRHRSFKEKTMNIFLVRLCENKQIAAFYCLITINCANESFAESRLTRQQLLVYFNGWSYKVGAYFPNPSFNDLVVRST